MFMRIAIACFALYCVHGAQNTARDGAALAEKGANLAREASAEAPRAALSFCLENQALCSQAIGTKTIGAKTVGIAAPETVPAKTATLHAVDHYPLPPRRPASHKKA